MAQLSYHIEAAAAAESFLLGLLVLHIAYLVLPVYNMAVRLDKSSLKKREA